MGNCGTKQPAGGVPRPNSPRMDQQQEDTIELPLNADHFEIIKAIGQGTFGSVHAAVHEPTGKVYALKRMSKLKVLSSTTHQAAAWEERRVLCCSDSPFLLQLEHAFQTERALYLLLPLMTGGDMFCHFAHLDRKYSKIPEHWIRFFSAEIIMGLCELHSKDNLYRDLKPENVLINAGGHAVLSDFGLCVLLKEEKNFMTEGLSGTKKFMAPEIVRGDPYSFPADFFSLGVTIVWMICGHTDLHRFFVEPSKHTQPSETLLDLLRRLLRSQAHNRIGCGPNGRGWEDVMRHPWFNGLDWKAVLMQEIEPPSKPDAHSWQQPRRAKPGAYINPVMTPQRLKVVCDDPGRRVVESPMRDVPSEDLLSKSQHIFKKFNYRDTITLSTKDMSSAHVKELSRHITRERSQSQSASHSSPSRQRASAVSLRIKAAQGPAALDKNARGYSPFRAAPPAGGKKSPSFTGLAIGSNVPPLGSVGENTKSGGRDSMPGRTPIRANPPPSSNGPRSPDRLSFSGQPRYSLTVSKNAAPEHNGTNGNNGTPPVTALSVGNRPIPTIVPAKLRVGGART